MGHPSLSFHVLTLVTTALLAWPWNIVLSAAESSQVASQRRLVGTQAAERSGGHRLVRCGGWDRSGCSAIAPDYDRVEEEGDDGGPLSLSSVLATVQALASTQCPGSLVNSVVLPARLPSREHLCHLRC